MNHPRMNQPIDISMIGTELAAASRSLERSPGQILCQLFPYVVDASRRRSTRAISAWLKENYGVQISQPTLSRALRNPDKYGQAFADYLEPASRQIEEAIDAS